MTRLITQDLLKAAEEELSRGWDAAHNRLDDDCATGEEGKLLVEQIKAFQWATKESLSLCMALARLDYTTAALNKFDREMAIKGSGVGAGARKAEMLGQRPTEMPKYGDGQTIVSPSCRSSDRPHIDSHLVPPNESSPHGTRFRPGRTRSHEHMAASVDRDVGSTAAQPEERGTRTISGSIPVDHTRRGSLTGRDPLNESLSQAKGSKDLGHTEGLEAAHSLNISTLTDIFTKMREAAE